MKPKEQLELAVEADPAAGAASFLPRELSLESLNQAAAGCKGCDRWGLGTRTVFGAGEPHSKVMLVGEHPGAREDVAGRPFLGPAGRVLADAMERAGIARSAV